MAHMALRHRKPFQNLGQCALLFLISELAASRMCSFKYERQFYQTERFRLVFASEHVRLYFVQKFDCLLYTQQNLLSENLRTSSQIFVVGNSDSKCPMEPTHDRTNVKTC